MVMALVSGMGCVALLGGRASIWDEVAEGRRVPFLVAFLLCLTGLLGIAATGLLGTLAAWQLRRRVRAASA